MICINQLKLPLGYDRKDMIEEASRILGVEAEKIDTFSIIKQSIDARKKPNILYSYVMDARMKQISGEKEEKLVRRLGDRDMSVQEAMCCHLPGHGAAGLKHPPVIIRAGPAGLFCGLMLVRQGYCPVLLERGEDVDTGTKRVAGFWEGGELHPGSSVRSREGGTGTFSDGKLGTLVKDSFGRNRAVLQILVEFGADPSILYVDRPRIGMDVLSQIVKAMRREIQQLGDQVRFPSRAINFVVEKECPKAVVVNGVERIRTRALVTAIDHSARDTFEVLRDRGIPMKARVFAMGLRVQHLQTLINMSQYAAKEYRELEPASYKVTRQTSSGKGVYSFCICPGGYVVNVSFEQSRPVVNGMSYHDRTGENADSVLIATVTPEDFLHTRRPTLEGTKFQHSLEEAVSWLGKGSIPVQLHGSSKEDRISVVFGQVIPALKGEYASANLREMLPSYISRSLSEAIGALGHMIKDLNRLDAVLTGIRGRTPSPVRMSRGKNLESTVKGIFPCGERAGYTGGIISAAVDGIHTIEEIIRRYRPFRT